MNNYTTPKSLYIHWPFCSQNCTCADSVAHVQTYDPSVVLAYHKVLCNQIKQFFIEHNNNLSLESVFIGGGTPCTYPDQLLLDMSGTLNNVCSFGQKLQTSIEVNLGIVTLQQIDLWHTIGINRLNIIVDAQSIKKAFDLISYAQKYIQHFSFNFKIDSYGMRAHDYKALFEQVVRSSVGHVTLDFMKLPQQLFIDFYQWVTAFLISHGFNHYELFYFARDGQESHYMNNYWQRQPYHGFGLGAESFDGHVRTGNKKEIEEYLTGSVVNYSCRLTKQQVKLEEIMFGLRRPSGLLEAQLYAITASDHVDLLRTNIAWLEDNNFLVRNNKKLILTPLGVAVQDAVVLKLSL